MKKMTPTQMRSPEQGRVSPKQFRRQALFSLMLSLFSVVGFSGLQAQWTFPVIGGSLPNSATALGNDCFEFTNNTNQRGVVWNNTPLDLSQAFDITLTVSQTPNGADGIALVLQQTGLAAHGAGGNGNGYANAVPASAYPGISPSVAFELDCFDNSGAGVADIPAHHVAIHTNGIITSAAAGPAAAIPNGNNITDGVCRRLRVVWTPAPVSQFDMYFNNQLRLSWTNDVVNTIFGGNPIAFWGLTGSCGSVPMTQRVCVGAEFANAGPDRSLCLGDTLHLNASGGTTYAWGIGFPLISNQNIPDPVFAPAFAQTYSLPLLVTNVINCTDRDTVLITALDTPQVAVSVAPAAICPGETVQFTANATGGANPLTYLWNDNSTAASFSITPSASIGFQVSVTDANDCASSAAGQVTVHPADSIDITLPDTLVCLGSSIAVTNTFSTAGIDTYAWTPGSGVVNPSDANPTITPSVSTTYYLMGENSTTGCGTTDSLHIDVFQLQLQHFTDTTLCLGDSLSFDLQPSGGSGSYSFQWADNTADTLSDDSIADPGLRPTVSGTYTATVTDDVSGCMLIFPIQVTVQRLQVTATPGSILINPGQRVQMSASGAMFYTWAPDTMINCPTCSDPVAMPSASITYTVTGTDTAGCIGTATVVIVTDSLLVPNVFTPNGDGINDILLLNYHGNAFYEISVFDRWGQQIFTTKDKALMWDGRTSGGTNAPEGVYYLAVRVIGDHAIPDKDKQRVFHVTLMR